MQICQRIKYRGGPMAVAKRTPHGAATGISFSTCIRRMSFRRSQRAFIDSRTQKESTHTKMHPGFIFITSQLHTYDRSLSKMAAGAPREQAGYKRMRTSSAIPRTRQSFSLHAID
ncbi:uncharacterized protein LOC125067200 isoform X2 [Vanessa atalanta]|uniref:uncharacterized protein LOC125067200 isoform X2 n=1 Tax=Vanessa atalanta TaxID=42275 RepID=UPI001FCCEE54|nr:uncharacterized protein LOC125067200 isoform X2 [Vanessa atalanta]